MRKSASDFFAGRQRRGSSPAGHSRRENVGLLLPWILVALGIVLVVAAAFPQIERVDEAILAGEVPPRVADPRPFPYEGYSFVTLAFQERPNCRLFLFPLNAEQATRFEETGDLPDIRESLNCDAGSQEATLSTPIALLVFNNTGDEPLPYVVAVELFVVQQPWAILAVPAVILFVLGVSPLVARFLGGRITELVVEQTRESGDDQQESERGKKR